VTRPLAAAGVPDYVARHNADGRSPPARVAMVGCTRPLVQVMVADYSAVCGVSI
jgi:hypothetical protein